MGQAVPVSPLELSLTPCVLYDINILLLLLLLYKVCDLCCQHDTSCARSDWLSERRGENTAVMERVKCFSHITATV